MTDNSEAWANVERFAKDILIENIGKFVESAAALAIETATESDCVADMAYACLSSGIPKEEIIPILRVVLESPLVPDTIASREMLYAVITPMQAYTMERTVASAKIVLGLFTHALLHGCVEGKQLIECIHLLAPLASCAKVTYEELLSLIIALSLVGRRPVSFSGEIHSTLTRKIMRGA